MSDYVIEFPTPLILEASTIGTSGLLSHRKRKIERNEETLPLSDTLFNEDALIFSDIACDWIRLRKKNEKKGNSITVGNILSLMLGGLESKRMLKKVILMFFSILSKLISCGKQYFLYYNWQRVKHFDLKYEKTLLITHKNILYQFTIFVFII